MLKTTDRAENCHVITKDNLNDPELSICLSDPKDTIGEHKACIIMRNYLAFLKKKEN